MHTTVAVVGVGAIGGALAADLADLGRYRVLLCARTPFDRLVVRHPAGTSEVAGPPTTDPRQASPVDWVLLATKAHQSATARTWLDALSGPGTRIAIVQNGVDHVERVAPWVGAGVALLPVVVQLPAEKRAPGRVEQSRDGILLVPDAPDGHAFAALFEGARTAVRPTGDFLRQAWSKLLSNAALGAVCALCVRENAIVRDPEIREIVLRMMAEIVAVGRAEGVALPDDAPAKVIDRVLDVAADHWSSITVDRREGRPMEWEARNAVVGRLGRRHGIPTPWNDAMTALLRAADARPRA